MRPAAAGAVSSEENGPKQRYVLGVDQRLVVGHHLGVELLSFGSSADLAAEYAAVRVNLGDPELKPYWYAWPSALKSPLSDSDRHQIGDIVPLPPKPLVEMEPKLLQPAARATATATVTLRAQQRDVIWTT